MFDRREVPETERVVPRAALPFVAAPCPTVVAAVTALALIGGWSWWGWALAVAGGLGSASLAWGAWAAARR